MLPKNLGAFVHLAYPALLAGIDLLCGAAAALTGDPIIFSSPLCVHALFRMHLYRGIVFVLCAYAYTRGPTLPIFPRSQRLRAGCFSIRSLKVASSAFGKNYMYEGTLSTFTAEDGTTYRNLPCRIMVPLKKIGCPPPATIAWRERYAPRREEIFSSSPSHGPLCRDGIRRNALLCKNCSEQLSKAAPSKICKVASFFSSLATGDIDERALSLEFGKIGVNHLLAISGFHFALLTTFCSFILRPLSSPQNDHHSAPHCAQRLFFLCGQRPFGAAGMDRHLYLFDRLPLFDLRSNALNSSAARSASKSSSTPTASPISVFSSVFRRRWPSCSSTRPAKAAPFLLPKRPLLPPRHHDTAPSDRASLLFDDPQSPRPQHRRPLGHSARPPFRLLEIPGSAFSSDLFYLLVGISIFLLLYSSPHFPPLARPVDDALTFRPASNFPHTPGPSGILPAHKKPSPTQWSFGSLLFFCLGILYKEPALRAQLFSGLITRWHQATGYRFLKRRS